MTMQPAELVPAFSAPGPVAGIRRRILAQVSTDKPTSAGLGQTALTAFGVRVLSAAIAYVTQMVLARWMGSSEYGIYVWIWVWVLILGGLSALGLQVAIIRFVPQYLERGEMDLLAGVLRAGRAIPVAISTGVASLGLVGLQLWGDALPLDYRLPLYLAMGCLPLYTLTEVQDGIGRGRGWIMLGLLPPYVLRPLLILAAMVAAHAFGWPMLATTAAAAALIATWGTGLVQWLFMQRRLAHELAATVRPRYVVGEWMLTSLPICFISACELLQQNLDVLVLTRYVDASHVGIYFAAQKSIGLVAFVNYAVGSAIAGRLSALNARGDLEGVRHAVQRGALLTFLPSVAGAVVLLAIGGPLLSMFGKEFTSGTTLMFVLAAGFVIRAAVGPAEYVLRMLGEQTLCAWVLGSTAAVYLLLALLFVPLYGTMGAAVANTVTMALSAIMFWVLAKQRLGFDVSVLSSLRGFGSR